MIANAFLHSYDAMDELTKVPTDEEKKRALMAAGRKFFARLGLNPDLAHAEIHFVVQSPLPYMEQLKLAAAKGVQIPLQYVVEKLLFDI